MLTLDFSKLNWAAIAVCAVSTFFLGAIWYSALFGKLWQRLQGFTDEQVKAMQAKMNPAKFFGGMLGAYFVLSVVTALLVVALDLRSAGSGLLLGLLLWLGPTSAVAYTGWLASGKVFGTYLLDAAYQFIYMLMIGVILAVWR